MIRRCGTDDKEGGSLINNILLSLTKDKHDMHLRDNSVIRTPRFWPFSLPSRDDVADSAAFVLFIHPRNNFDPYQICFVPSVENIILVW